MAITDKQMLIREMEKALADKLTVKDVNIVATALVNELTKYNIEREAGDDKATDTQELINAFLNAKVVAGCSQKTIKHYRYTIKRLLEGVNVPLRDITVYHLRGYLMSEKERGIADGTLISDRNVYNSMFGWLHREGLLPSNPCGNLEPIRKKKDKKKAFTDVEIEKMRDACTTVRDKAIIYFLLSTGCRISETCDLDAYDIDFQTGECIVLGKGNKERTVYITPIASMYLQAYLETRKHTGGPLFLNRYHERLTPGGVRAMLKRIEARTGVENIHPHKFRRTLATVLIKRGMTIQEVARILGHEKIDTTMKYICLDDRDVKHDLLKYA